MNPAKCKAEEYIQWLIATPKIATCTQAALCAPTLVAHDAYTRLLERLEPNSDALWEEVHPLVSLSSGWLIFDDTTLDKPYARNIELVCKHWSGKHHQVVDGINLLTLLWTDGDLAIPVDWRVLDKSNDGKSKNNHLREMLETARQRGFTPKCMLWDSWYSSLENLKMLREWKWPFFVGLKSNRMADPDAHGNRPICELPFEEGHLHAHLKGFGWVEMYRVCDDEEKKTYRYFAGSEATLAEEDIQQRREHANQIEQYHRTLKQQCHAERCHARKGRKQKNHIALSIRTFVRLSLYHFHQGVSPFEVKQAILREAIRIYRSLPFCSLPKATA